MKNEITLPINFEDGSNRKVDIYTDDPDGQHYSLMIGAESAGSIQFSDNKNEWTYVGELSQDEQAQIAGFIQNYDWKS